ncbi:MAG: hypothetical protein WC115_09645 [Sphaerochaeta sp.]
MTRVKDLKTENHQLKTQVNDLKKELEFYTKKDHETSKLSNWLSITHYDDGRYIVTGPIVKSSFRVSTYDDALIYKQILDCEIEHAAFQTKQLFLKTAIDWMKTTEYPQTFGNINFYVSDLIPTDSVIIHPELKNVLDSFLITSGVDVWDIESRFKRDMVNGRS